MTEDRTKEVDTAANGFGETRQQRRAAEREAAKAAESDAKATSMEERREVNRLTALAEGAHTAARAASTALVAFIRGHMTAVEVTGSDKRILVIQCPEGMGLRSDVSQMLASALGCQVLVLPGGSTVDAYSIDELMAFAKQPARMGLVDANGDALSK